MKREPLQNLKQRTGQYLLAILALLMMPAGMWAEDFTYDLWVAGVQVTGANASNVLGDEGTPSVVFDGDHTLTLNALSYVNYDLEGSFISNGIGNIAINLVGESFIWAGSKFLSKSEEAGDNYTVTFTTDRANPGNLGLRYDQEWYTGHTPAYNNGLVYNISDEEDDDYHVYDITIDVVRYDLTIGGVQVTSANASNVLFLNEHQQPSAVFDASTNTLTLNELSAGKPGVPYIMNGLENLTINLVGNSHVDECTYFIAKSGDGDETNNVTFTTSSSDPGELSVWCDNPSPWYTGHTLSWKNGLGWKQQYDSDLGDGFYISTDHGLSVGGFILRDNQGNTFNDGPLGESVTLDGNTLTLNNATINGNIVVRNNVLSTLTIKVKGQNVINAGNQSAIMVNIHPNAQTSTVALSFIKDGEGDCSLQLNSDDGIPVISDGFDDDELTYTDLALVVEDESWDVDYYSNRGMCHYAYPDYYPINSATITSYTTYGITVNGEAVTSINKNSIKKGAVGVGHISFDGDHTLTLNKVPNIVFDGTYPFIQTSMNLTINLVGVNEFDCGQSVFITRPEGDNRTYTVTFTTDEDHAGSLILTVGDRFDGFEAAYENGLSRDPDCYYDPEDSNKPAAWIAQASLGLKVGGIVVTQGNSSDILGNGYASVSYNSTTNTLTLTSCHYSHYTANFVDIASSITSLNVRLIGYNEIGYGSYGDEAHWLSAASAFSVNIITDANVPGKLEYWNGDITDSNVTLNFSDSGLALDGTTIAPVGGTDNIAYFGTGQFHDGTDGGTGDENYPYYDYVGSCWYYSNAVMTDRKSDLPPTVIGTETSNGYVSRMKTSGSNGIITMSFQYAWVNSENTSVSVALTSLDGATTYAIGNMTANGSVVTLTPNADITMEDVCLTFTSDSQFAFLPLAVKTISPQTYPLTIAGTPVTSKNADDVLGDGKVSYDAESNILTLNGATIGDNGSDPEPIVAEACGIEYTGGENLTISLKGTNTITGTGGCEAIRCDAYGLETVPKLIFTKGDNLTCSLQLSAEESRTVISGFSDIDGINGINEATGNALAFIFEEAVSYDSESDGLYYLDNEEEPVAVSSAVITSGYGLSVGGVLVYEGNASNVMSDEETPTVVFDAVNNILSLSGASIPIMESNKPAIESSLASLTIQLDGSNCIIFNGDYSGYIVSSTNADATLTFSASDGAQLSANISDSQYVGSPANGFKTVSYNNSLVYIAYGTSTQYIKQLDTPSISLAEGNLSLTSSDYDEQYTESLAIKYSIDYVDNSLTDVTNATYSSETSLAISSPCTITAHVEYNGKSSADVTAINFGFTEPMKVVYEGEDFELTDMPDIVPTLEGVRYVVGESSNSEVVEFKPESSTCMVRGYGSTDISVYLMIGNEYTGPDFTMLNNNTQATLTVNVIPPTPTIGLEGGEVLYTEAISITSTLENATIKYQWNDNEPQTYTEAIRVQTGTLKAWVEVSSVASDIVEATYTPMLDVAFVGSNSWASYYATENLALPEGLTAYVVSEVNEATGVVTVQSVDYIPAENGVLLKREEGGAADGYVAEAYDGATATVTNLLGGSTNTTNVSSFNNAPVYVLFNDKFKRATSGTIPARRAYLALGAAMSSAGAPQFLTLNVVDGDVTAISTLAADDNDGSWYTLEGLKLSGKPQHKGVYIKNGKKVFFNNHK